jgi:uncharacterized protein YutE (UPF0331/DUF86 family)
MPIAAKSRNDYLAGSVDETLAERYLERMIDINYHLITETGQAPPRDYYESFTQLAKLHIVPAAFASQIAARAGLRDRIVHEYDEIDPARVYEGLQASVRDIPSIFVAYTSPCSKFPLPDRARPGGRRASSRRRSGAVLQ